MSLLDMEWGSHVILRATMTSLLLLSLDAYHDGADPRACGDMIPQHGSVQRADRPPYYTQVSDTTYTPGVPITVTLSSNRGDYFKGFLIQARISELGPDFDKAVGTFIPVPGTKSLCLWSVGLTHTNDNPKSNLTFTWNPPDKLQGKIQFRTTFVQSQYSYWVAQLSDVLNEGEITTLSTTTTTSTTSATSTTTSTTPLPSSQTSVMEPATSPTVTSTVSSSERSDQTTVAVNSSMTTPFVRDSGGTVTSSFVYVLVGLGLCLVTRRLETS